MARTALGEDPHLDRGGGAYTVARKHFHRQVDDAVLETRPAAEEIAAIEERFAPCVIEIGAREGERLSDQEDQEPYSYEIAELYLAGHSEEEVEAKRQAVLDALDLHLAPVG